MGERTPIVQGGIDWKVEKYEICGQEIPAIWDDLNARCTNNNPLLTASFSGSLVRYFGGDNIYMAVLRVNKKYAGVALLSRISKFRWEVFTPAQAPLGLVIIDERLVSYSVAAHSLLMSLPGHALRLDFLCIDPLHVSSDIDVQTMDSTQHVKTMSIRNTRSFSEYLAERPRSLRNNIRRNERRLSDEAKRLSIQYIYSVDGMDMAVEKHGQLEQAGWKGVAGTAITQGTAQGDFYAEIMRREAECGRAMVIQLYVDEKLAASRLIIMGGEIAVMLKTAYDESLSRFAVGRVLLKIAIERILDSSEIHWIEFYTNASVDQLQWATDSRFIEHRSIYRNSAVRTSRELCKKMLDWTRSLAGAMKIGNV